MHERIKEHDGDIRFARTQTSLAFGHANGTRHYRLWDKIKFIESDPRW